MPHHYRFTIQQAAVNALVAFLKTQFDPDVVITDSWPEQSCDLPAKSITVLLAGKRQDENVGGSYERAISSEAIPGGGNRRTYRWTVKACQQAIQLDVWARTDLDREELLCQLDTALHQGERVTLGTAGGNPFRDGVLLRIADGFEGFVDFLFEDGPDRDNAGDGATRGEFRATQMGTGSCVLTLTAETPQFLVAKLKLALGETPPSTTDTYTISATGFSQSTP